MENGKDVQQGTVRVWEDFNLNLSVLTAYYE